MTGTAELVLWLGIICLILGLVVFTTPIKIVLGPLGTYAGPGLMVVGGILIMVALILDGRYIVDGYIFPHFGKVFILKS